MVHVVVLKHEAQCFPWGTEDAGNQPFSPSMSQHVLLFAPDMSYANCLLQPYVTHNIWQFFHDENFMHWTAINNWKARHLLQLLQWLTYAAFLLTCWGDRLLIISLWRNTLYEWCERLSREAKQILISDLSDFLYRVKKGVGPCVFTVRGPCLRNIFLPNTVSQIVATYTHTTVYFMIKHKFITEGLINVTEKQACDLNVMCSHQSEKSAQYYHTSTPTW
jgi:hypothetical protein